MKLPIDTSSMQFIGVLAPEQVLDFETKAPKTDNNGEVLWAVQVAAMAQDSAEIIKVTVAGEPRIDQGAMLRLDRLVASPWAMGDRSGVSFRAEKMEPLAGAAPSSSRPKADG